MRICNQQLKLQRPEQSAISTTDDVCPARSAPSQQYRAESLASVARLSPCAIHPAHAGRPARPVTRCPVLLTTLCALHLAPAPSTLLHLTCRHSSANACTDPPPAVSDPDPGPAIPTPAASGPGGPADSDSGPGSGPPPADSDSRPGGPAHSDSGGPADSNSGSTGPPSAGSNSGPGPIGSAAPGCDRGPGCSAAPDSGAGRDVQHKRARCSSSSSAASSTEGLPPDEPADPSAARACKSRWVHEQMEDSDSESGLMSSSESEIIVDDLDEEAAPTPPGQSPTDNPTGDDGWQTAGPKRQRRSSPAASALSAGASPSLPPRLPSRSQSPLPPPPRATKAPAAAQPASLPKLLIPATIGFETTLDLAEALERQLSQRLSLKFLESGCVLITPADRAQHDTLLAPLLGHPRVLEAERYTTRDGPTRQVYVTVAGPLPGSLDLGSWGTFYTRPYSKEPLRCYNCQQFGQYLARCSRPPVCGICSARHDMERCLTKYKAGQAITSRCPNCQEEHHAWNRACANRRELVDKQRTVQQRWVVTHRPAPLGTFRWGDQQPHASTAAPTPRLPQTAHPSSLAPSPPAPFEESFPPLAPSHLPSTPLPKRPAHRPALPLATLCPPAASPAPSPQRLPLPPLLARTVINPTHAAPLCSEDPPSAASRPRAREQLRAPTDPPPPPVATSQHSPLVAPPTAPTSLNAGGLPTRPVVDRDPRSRKLSM
ncbi:proline-rich protein 36-like [Eriocheir sinensis]|uniref:proline-rich protein 36-like n=1 Tax=Eriocheir sinensis TaxID=95602 RepID=UPI0021CA9E3C|nr:proline-rich protein 36-like [Eriocheir sinensis]